MEYTAPRRLIFIIIITLVILPVSLSFYFRAINGIDYGIGKYTQYRRDQIGLKLIAEAEKRYHEDTYGGKTPGETMELFIAALKKGDIELASKYFDLSKQSEQLARLKKYRDKQALVELIYDLEHNLKETESIYPETKRFTLYDSKKNETGIFNLYRSVNDLWKIKGIF